MSFQESEQEEEFDDLDEKIEAYNLQEKINTHCAYAYDTTPDDYDQFSDLDVDSEDEETLSHVWDWKVSMLLDYTEYENHCPYGCDGECYNGMKCPECRRWNIPHDLPLCDQVERKRCQENRVADLQRLKKKKNPPSIKKEKTHLTDPFVSST